MSTQQRQYGLKIKFKKLIKLFIRLGELEREEFWLTNVLYFTSEPDLLVTQGMRRGSVLVGHSRCVYFGNIVGVPLRSASPF